MRAKIIATGAYAPPMQVTNDDLAGRMDTSDEWIRTRTGIRSRHIAEKESAGDMAAKAAKRALEAAGITAEELDLIITATSSAESVFPGISCLVQGRLGGHAACMDVGAACSGFVYALSTAQAMLSAGLGKTALVIGAECLSRIVDWKDRSTCVLFGDGAGAVILRADTGGPFAARLYADGGKGSVLSLKQPAYGIPGNTDSPYLSMDGQEVFKFACKRVPECISELLLTVGRQAEDIRYFMLHQANYRIVENVAKRMGLSMEQFPTNVERYGNTSAASVPILLDEWNRAGKLKEGEKLVLAGFGAGLTWGAAYLEW